jgi:hypothetical protein
MSARLGGWLDVASVVLESDDDVDEDAADFSCWISIIRAVIAELVCVLELLVESSLFKTLARETVVVELVVVEVEEPDWLSLADCIRSSSLARAFEYALPAWEDCTVVMTISS